MKYNFYKVSEFYRYENRSCLNCRKFPDCTPYKKRDWSQPTLDRARCGALCYAGPHEKEKPLFKDMRGK